MNETSNYMESIGKYTKWLFIVLIAFSFVLLSSCKKEEEWEWCQDCTIDSLVGEYKGLANISIDQGPKKPYLEITDLEITIIITEVYGKLRITVDIPESYSESFLISYSDTYYLTYGNRLNVTIRKFGNRLKLIGIIKYGSLPRFYQLIDFEVYKES